MPLNSLRDCIVNEVRDMYSAEKQLLKALPKLAKGANSTELKAAFEKHFEETKQQLTLLEDCFGLLGLEPRAKACKGMEGILEEGSELLKQIKDGDPATCDAALIAAAQKAEHYEIAAYGTLRSWCQATGNPEVAKICERILEQESRTNETLTQIASRINKQAEMEPGAGF